MPVDVDQRIPASALGIFAHPDDAESAVGGTFAYWARGGTKIDLCVVAQGEKGSHDPNTSTEALAIARKQEAVEAGEIIGVSQHHFFEMGDGEIENTAELRERIVALIRAVEPEVIVCGDPTSMFFGREYVNHRDHRVLGEAVLDACSPAAGMPLYFPNAGPPHQVQRIYMSGTLRPDVWVDISSTIEIKSEALAKHVSQVDQPGEWLHEVVRQRAESSGEEAGVEAAESFRLINLA